VLSVVLFAVTRSAFTLVFAALGPVVAISSLVDARVSRSRSRRREHARFRADLEAAIRAVAAAHDAERVERAALVPHPAALVGSPHEVAARWTSRVPDVLQLRAGAGEAASHVTLGGGVGAVSHPAIDDLRDRASRLVQAPVALPITTGGAVVITVSGPAALRDAVVRGLVLQLAASLSPDDWRLRATTDDAWTDRLPHPRDTGERDAGIAFVCGARSIGVCAVGSARAGGAGVRVEVRQDGTAVIDDTLATLDCVGLESANLLAAQLGRMADDLGIGLSGSSALADVVEFETLPMACDERTLEAAVGESTEGVLTLDLVRQGPHAVIGGTTGSGKSELLLSWVLGMAAGRSPRVVTFLFVDFKGGASFGDLANLPHSVGVLTDLDGARSQRALASLAAELRHRERELAALTLRSLDDSLELPFPRLVVVVDEYAALVDAFPELHTAFADIAARGRSLGVHLVLCTQRPAGVVRDGILANCALRLSLRVTSAADSVALLGTDAAATLPARPLGRALVSAGGEAGNLFQVARSTGADVTRVASRWASAERPRVPWLPPLPVRVDRGALGVGTVADDLPFALADLPHEQDQRVARYEPRTHGSLLVLGASGSGRSGVLAALSSARSTLRVVRVSREFAVAWDQVTTALASHPGAGTVMLFDDLDVLLSASPPGYLDGFLELLARLLREGPGAGTWCVLVAARAGGHLSTLVPLCGSRLVLRMPDRTEHSFAGADTAYDPKLPPGGGFWHGDRVQVVVAEPPPDDDPPVRTVPVDVSTADFAVVSSNPHTVTERLRDLAPERRVVALAPSTFGAPRDQLEVSRGGAPAIVVADADTWQSQWSLFTAVQRATVIVFDGCSLAEVRALTRSRDLPPPCARGERPLWMRTPDGSLCRARFVTTWAGV
jgi:S-DNA-T family DNA segregation ATPase FtsK/SpoIIIE